MSSRYEVVYSSDDFCRKCNSGPCRCGEQARPQTRRALPPARPPGSEKGGPKIRLDRSGRKGKAVTVVFNLGLAEPALRDLLRDLQKACGSGGTVADGQVEIQGDHRDRIEARLNERGIRVKRAGG
jgi:translation initiation factor 1